MKALDGEIIFFIFSFIGMINGDDLGKSPFLSILLKMEFFNFQSSITYLVRYGLSHGLGLLVIHV